jgi:hypothetical protein
VHETTVETTRLRLLLGDITKIEADAIVNAANEELWPGGGVSGAIHRAGGMMIEDECRRIGHTPTGQAAITTAGRLPARHVIHAVGPIWKGGSADEPELLVSLSLEPPAGRRARPVVDRLPFDQHGHLRLSDRVGRQGRHRDRDRLSPTRDRPRRRGLRPLLQPRLRGV